MPAQIHFSQRSSWAVGQPISELMSRALDNPNLISLAAGFVDQQTLPDEPTRTALTAIFNDTTDARAALQYGTTPGFPPLREALLERILQQDGCPADSISLDQIVVRLILNDAFVNPIVPLLRWPTSHR